MKTRLRFALTILTVITMAIMLLSLTACKQTAEQKEAAALAEIEQSRQIEASLPPEPPEPGSDEALINTVKNATLPEDKSVTYGSALDGYPHFDVSGWDVHKTEQGRRIVKFDGLMKLPPNATLDKKPLSSVSVIFLFVVNVDDTVDLLSCGYTAEFANGQKRDSDFSVHGLQKLWTGKPVGYDS